VLQLQDSGIGMAPEMMSRAFNLFAQGERALDRRQGGLGMGLTLVKYLIELHGGRVSVSSPGLQLGCTFTLRLPVADEEPAFDDNIVLSTVLVAQRKVVVVDCDNTLWRGVVGEVGPEGLEFDEGHRALHTALTTLAGSGVLVCLCSKNEEADVWRVFEARPDFGLRREHVVTGMINWLPKSQNLRTLAGRLNLGLDSFVFLDDNPVECAEVRAGCLQQRDPHEGVDGSEEPELDLVKVQRLEEDLKTARADAQAERSKPTSDRVAQLSLDPTYRQLTADREMSRLRIRDLQRSEGDLRRQIGSYQARVESAPRVEQQLASVQRDYDLERQQYSELSSKLRAASIAENVEKDKSGEQFTVLYPATMPAEPVKPVPWRVMLIAVVAGLCLGGAATLGREYLDRSVHDVRDLREEFQLPVLGEVARIQPV